MSFGAGFGLLVVSFSATNGFVAVFLVSIIRGFGDPPVEARASGYRNSNTALASSAGTHFRGERFYGETQNPLFFCFQFVVS